MVWNYQDLNSILEDFLNRPGKARLVYKNRVTVEKPIPYEYNNLVQMGLAEIIKAKICQEILGVLEKEGTPEKELSIKDLKIVDSEF